MNHPNLLEADPFFSKLTEVLDGCIGDSFSDEELKAIYKEGKERYDKSIPPGYMDKKDKEKNGDQSLYGDVIIWKELLRRFGKSNSDNVIFITDDLKEDWWYTFGGNTISPRYELLKEFRDITGKGELIYKPIQFLKFAKSYLKQKLGESAVEEVEFVRKNDESLFREFLQSHLMTTPANPIITVDEAGNPIFNYPTYYSPQFNNLISPSTASVRSPFFSPTYFLSLNN